MQKWLGACVVYTGKIIHALSLESLDIDKELAESTRDYVMIINQTAQKTGPSDGLNFEVRLIDVPRDKIVWRAVVDTGTQPEPDQMDVLVKKLVKRMVADGLFTCKGL
jgi:hypothetical protein